MIDATPLLRLYARWRAGRLAHQKGSAVQVRTLQSLLSHAAGTRFGRDHGFSRLRDRRAFQDAVPLRRYEDFWNEYWQPAFPRLVDCCWPGLVPYFAASSGTSAGVTKYIPVTRRMLLSNRRAGLDLVVHHLANRPDSRLFAGRNLILGGCSSLVERAPGVHSGDLSGIAAATLPLWARPFAFPPAAISGIADWTEKMVRLTERAPQPDIRSISGTPSWLLLLFDELLRRHPDGEARLNRFFPNLDLVVHGGVNFAPYRRRFAEWLIGSHAETREAYAASEGFIAAADRGDGEGLRLILDHGLFYEFVPVGEVDAAQPTRHWLGNVETGINYAIVVTTCAGLFAFVIGDTVRFVSRDPPRLLVTGRLSYTLSAFGEHLTGEEIEAAIVSAATEIGAGVRDFAVGALYPQRVGEIGGHLFFVELEEPVAPDREPRFAAVLDAELAARNLDYRDHRAGGFGMRPPEICFLPHGAFAEWMLRRGRLGAQNKVPRVINNPELFADLCGFAQSQLGWRTPRSGAQRAVPDRKDQQQREGSEGKPRR